MCPSAYRPLTMLNVDTQVLCKVLVERLRAVVVSLVHDNQSGFMPGCPTALNLNRLAHVRHSVYYSGEELAKGLGDITKAFDTLQWTYLMEVLLKVGFGPNFCKWVRLLCTAPRARVRSGGVVSDE